jgi:hypothetical protein
MTVVISLLLVSLFTLFVLVLGYTVSNKGYDFSGSPLSYKVGVSYFFGIASWIAILRIISFLVVDVSLSILITLVLTSIFIIYNRVFAFGFLKSIANKKSYLCMSILVVSFSPFLLLYWLPLTLTPDDVNALIGSLHSGRYVALSNYILSCDFVPVIGQNIGQSLLVASVSYLFESLPFIYLFTFLLFSIIFLSLLVYGLSYQISNNVKTSMLSSVVFMMGNCSLSFAHVMSIDSGSPFLLNGYTDTLIGVFVVIMMLNIIVAGGINFNNKWRLLLVCLLFVVSFICAPQNIVVFSMALCFLTLFFIIRDRVLKYKSLWSILILSFIIGVPMGGMLTPSNMQQPIPLVGVQSVKNSQSGIRLDPWVPFYITINSNWPEGTDQTRWFGGQGVFTFHKNSKHHFSEVIYYYEQTFFMGLRNLFFPMAGLFLLALFGYYYKQIGSNSTNNVDVKSIESLSVLGSLFLVFGFVISYPIILNSYKLELSRFLIPGITLGLLALVTVLSLSYRYLSNKLHVLLILLCCISFVGPLSNSFNRVCQHFSEIERLPIKAMLSAGEPIYDNMCLLPSQTAVNRTVATAKVLSLGLAPLDKITLGKNLELDLFSVETMGKKLSSLGVLVSSSGLYNPGYLKLTVEDEFGGFYEVRLSSLDTKENQYNVFELKPGFYVSAKLTSTMPGHIVPWSSNGSVCLAKNFEGAIVYTEGCPTNTK